NPPGGIRRKLESTPVIKLVDSAHQPDVAFLNEVQEVKTAIAVFLGNGNNQAQVGFDNLPFGSLRLKFRSRDLFGRATKVASRRAGLSLDFPDLAIDPFYFFLNPFSRFVPAANGFAFEASAFLLEWTNCVHG